MTLHTSKGISTVRAYGGLIATFMIWGSLYVVSSLLLKSLPTFFVAFFRFFIAFVTLSAILRFQHRGGERASSDEKQSVRIDRGGYQYILILGLGGYVISVGMQLIGTKLTGSSTASLINSLNPIAISLFAVPILHEKLTVSKIAGILLAIVGVYLILGDGASVDPLGAMLSLLAVGGWALASVLTRRGLSKYDPLAITRAAVGVSAAGNFILCILEAVHTPGAIPISFGTIVGLIYLGVVCTGVAYVLWNRGLAALPASNCSALYPIQPLTSAALGILVFHERLSLRFAIGGILILVGVLISILLEELLFADLSPARDCAQGKGDPVAWVRAEVPTLMILIPMLLFQ